MIFKDNCVCIIICINYSDYLAYTIQHNLSLFKKIIVVTTATDKETIELIQDLPSCTLYYTTKMNQHNSVFNKSAMVREAQKYVYTNFLPTDWICLLDADVVLPLELGQLNLDTLNKKGIYGIVRHIYENAQDSTYIMEKNKYIIGYFQLYYKREYYARNSYNASKCDDEFNQYFKSKYRIYLDSLTCIHVGPTGINWNGRVSEIYIKPKSLPNLPDMETIAVSDLQNISEDRLIRVDVDNHPNK